jgi:hypothetical protein
LTELSHILAVAVEALEQSVRTLILQMVEQEELLQLQGVKFFMQAVAVEEKTLDLLVLVA